MDNTFTNQLRLEKMAVGFNENVWGDIANKQLELIEDAIAGREVIVVGSDDVSLSQANGDFDKSRKMFLDVSGTLTTRDVNIIVPEQPKMYIVRNGTTGAYKVYFKTNAAGGIAVEVPQGEIQVVVCDGTDCGVVNGVPTSIAEATNALELGGVVAANYARKDQGTPSDQVFTKAQAVARVNLSIVGVPPAATVDVDASLSNAFRLVMTANATLQNPTNPYDGQTIRIVVKQNGSGNNTLSYGSAYKFPGGSPPALSTGANQIDYLAFEYSGADGFWIGNLLKDLA